MARLRAVVMIHAAGFGGTPTLGHRSTAAANASWTASSAVSMSPQARTRTDTARPYCSRKTRSISDDGTSVTGVSAFSFVVEGTYFHRKRGRLRQPGSPFQRGVEIGRFDDGESAEVLLAFHEWSVGHERVAILHANDGRRARWMQTAGEHPAARRLELPVQGREVLHDGAKHFGRRDRAVGLVNAQQVQCHD